MEVGHDKPRWLALLRAIRQKSRLCPRITGARARCSVPIQLWNALEQELLSTQKDRWVLDNIVSEEDLLEGYRAEDRETEEER